MHIGPGSSNTDHCLARAVDEGQTANVNQNFVDTCNGRGTYSDMESIFCCHPSSYVVVFYTSLIGIIVLG